MASALMEVLHRVNEGGRGERLTADAEMTRQSFEAFVSKLKGYARVEVDADEVDVVKAIGFVLLVARSAGDIGGPPHLDVGSVLANGSGDGGPTFLEVRGGALVGADALVAVQGRSIISPRRGRLRARRQDILIHLVSESKPDRNACRGELGHDLGAVHSETPVGISKILGWASKRGGERTWRRPGYCPTKSTLANLRWA